MFDRLEQAGDELKRTAQQGQIAIASAEELIRNVNDVVLTVKRILTKLEGALK
jgi:hypothetical protein